MAGSSRLAAGAVLISVLVVAGDARQNTGGQASTASAQPSPQAQPSQQSPQAQEPPQGQQPPVFRAGINVVRVDVIVSDKSGAPVSDLKKEDFEVTEAGKRQQIDTFKLVSLDGGLMSAVGGPPITIRTDADEEVEAARDDVRLFGMFLDDYHVTRESSLAMRKQLARFIETQLGPSDMIGLMSPLEALSAVRMTRNHDAVMKALEEFEGRKGDYKPRNDIEARYVYQASAEQIEQIRNRASFAAMKALIMRMGGLKEGRKALILVSEGYSNTLPPQLRDPIGGEPGAGNPQRYNPNAGDTSLEASRQLFGSMDLTSDLRDLYDLANRNNVAIYAVDPRGLAVFEYGLDKAAVSMRTDRQYLEATMDTLRTLAESTDGRAIVNRNDLAIAMKPIVVDSSAYYLLGYTSTLAAPDGKFHEINVKVKRPGLEVRHRKGYWALKPEDVARSTAAAVAVPLSPIEAALATTATPRSRVIRTWIGSDRAANGQTRVTFVWEPMPRPAGDAVRDADRPARVMVTASGPSGPQYFRGGVPATSAAPPAAASSTGARVTFDAQPGKMQLRLSVEGAGSQVLDSEVREVTVPDLTSPQTVFGTTEVFRARTIPELQRLKTDPQPVPSASRDFSRTERLLIRVHAYGPGAPAMAPKLAARLLNRAGQSMLDLPVTPPGSAGALPQIELSLANLPAGDYGIEITATGEDGAAKDLVAFHVTP